ncbi:hypothetical protein ACIP5Y_24875 [Nocardia sp. NPDC088792]|uniref:hypothetical protein n=1 Tax=Nocardia sp. NPDC088792 TaxID=3364332 RepID=UPI00381D07FD
MQYPLDQNGVAVLDDLGDPAICDPEDEAVGLLVGRAVDSGAPSVRLYHHSIGIAKDQVCHHSIITPELGHQRWAPVQQPGFPMGRP